MRRLSLSIFFTVVCFNALAQNSSWNSKTVNQILTLHLPNTATHQKSSYINAYGGELNSNYYAIQYYDTIFLPVDNERRFQISLTGFMSGRVEDPTLDKYDAVVIDTTVGGTQGLFATFISSDTSQPYKRIYYFVTLANNQFYWFYVYVTSLDKTNNEIDGFFRSIKFDTAKIKEKSFKLAPVNLTKKSK